ncbi:MAG: hypothetical protein ACOZAA_13045, partial [Pseudomonadota bacterium]
MFIETTNDEFVNLAGFKSADVSPLAPAFIQRVLLLNTSWILVWRARRAQSRQVAQALGAR